MTETLSRNSLLNVQSSLQNPVAGVICVATAACMSLGQTQLPATALIPAHAGSVCIHCSMPLPMRLSPAWKWQWESQRHCQGCSQQSHTREDKLIRKIAQHFLPYSFVTKMEGAKKHA